MSPDIEGSINPWNLFGERHKKANGSTTNMKHRLRQFHHFWSCGRDEQTSECDISERHLRLIETVAGYPEILVGRRPLDMPLHPRSKLAFELSNFSIEYKVQIVILSGIPCALIYFMLISRCLQIMIIQKKNIMINFFMF